MAVQPDGKIVVAGGAAPGFGMLARLNPDGTLDRSFDSDGFVVDRDSLPFAELVLQPDGKIVVLNESGLLKRYDTDGSPDRGFGRAGVTDWLGIASEPTFLRLLPDGRLVLAFHERIKIPPTQRALAYVFSADGRSVEKVGELGAPAPIWTMHGLAVGADGTLLAAGLTSNGEAETFLARFVPGAGSPYDPAFGGGSGLVTIPHPGALPVLTALASAPRGWLAAGTVANHIVAARFSEEGALDAGFGSGGFAAASPGPGSLWANDLAIQPDGGIVVAGEAADREGVGSNCGCWRPLLLRFLANGALDPAFGDGGVARLIAVNGEPLASTASTAASLPDGRVLVAGRLTAGRPGSLVARVGGDGRRDRGFGEDGIATIDACPGPPAAQRRRGCLPSVRARLRVTRRPGGRVALRLNVRPSLGWAEVKGVSLTLPNRLRVVEEGRRRIRATLVEEDGSRRSTRVALDDRELSGRWFIGPRSVSLDVPASVLRRAGGVAAGRRYPFRVRVAFGISINRYADAGTHEIVLRRALG